MLSDEQIERYARHILLREVGGVGQEKILAAAIRLRGLGPIGCWAASYLALAGVGRLALDDRRPIPAGGLLPLVPAGRAGQRRDLGLAEEIPGFNPDVEVSTVQPAAVGASNSSLGDLLATASGPLARWGPGAPGMDGVWAWLGAGSGAGAGVKAGGGDDGSPSPPRSPFPEAQGGGTGFLAVAAGAEAILGWTDRICPACIRENLADPDAPPQDAMAALTGSLVAAALLAAILDPPEGSRGPSQGLVSRGIAGGQRGLPPCAHGEADG